MNIYIVVIARRKSQFTGWEEFKRVEIKAKSLRSAYDKAEKIYKSPYCIVVRVYQKKEEKEKC